MTKNEGIDRIREIQNGKGIPFSDFPVELKGRIALNIENNINSEMKNYGVPFEYGFEYGQICGIMEALNISLGDLQ